MAHELLSVTGLFLLGSTLLSLFVIVLRKLDVKTEKRPEPYHIPLAIPYLGHFLGIIWHRNRYYTKISAKYEKLPIYTLPILNGQVYIISEPALVLAAQRQPKIISFWQVEAISVSILGALSTAGGEKLKNIPSQLQQSQSQREEKIQGQGLLLDGLNATHRAMAPGQGFQQLLLAASETIAANLNVLSERATVHVDMWQWVKHEVTHATTESVYGPMNPYRDLAVESGFWDFADDAMWLLSGPVLSRFLASKGYKGRARVVAAFLEYFKKGGHYSGSDLVKARIKVMESELAPSDIAALECVNGQAILVNSVPTAFWTLWQVYSNQEILHAVREEVKVITKEDRKTIALPNLKSLPLLSSIVQETLRHRSCGIGARMVLENTILEDTYFLKKGSYVMLDNRSLHTHKRTWGPNTEDFDMNRFVKPIDQKRIQRSGAFRGFGGGANLCPGKDFATLEIMALVAMFVARFDMIPGEGEGRWTDPQQDLSNVSLAIPPPKLKVRVQIVKRDDVGGLNWRFDE